MSEETGNVKHQACEPVNCTVNFDIDEQTFKELFGPFTVYTLVDATGTELEVIKDIDTRQKHGINKYGTSVANNPLELKQWLQHAYEETLDKAVYLKRAIQEIETWEKKQKDCT